MRRLSKRWSIVFAMAAGLLALAAWLTYRFAGGASEVPMYDSAAAPAEDDDTALRRLVVGTWEDDYQGHRTMTLRPDGTGEMIVELSGLKATLFASRLMFEMEWSLDNGRLKKRTLRGEPAAQVSMILKTMGDYVDEPILELTAERLVLQDADGKTRYDWRRVSETSE